MDINSIFTQIKEAGKVANKEVGQNYLINPKIAGEIVDLLDVNNQDHVLEIGAGFGALSIFLLNKKYKSLTLNEIDPRAVEYLDALVENKHHTYVVSKSALKIEINSYTKVIGNLPYYITNDLLEHYFAKGNADKYVFMVQKEVFDRMIAKSNTSEYGPLSILVSSLGEAKKEIMVKRDNFLPAPHIDSLVFSLTNPKKYKFNHYQFLLFLKKMFIHRRKTIYNNLSLYLMNKNKAKDILNKLNISILFRPEQIESKTFVDIFNLCAKNI